MTATRCDLSDDERYWFPAKAPLTWQGWLAYLLWYAVFVGGYVYLRRLHVAFAFVLIFALAMVAVFVIIVRKKGDPARYTWWWRSNNRWRGP